MLQHPIQQLISFIASHSSAICASLLVALFFLSGTLPPEPVSGKTFKKNTLAERESVDGHTPMSIRVTPTELNQERKNKQTNIGHDVGRDRGWIRGELEGKYNQNTL